MVSRLTPTIPRWTTSSPKWAGSDTCCPRMRARWRKAGSTRRRTTSSSASTASSRRKPRSHSTLRRRRNKVGQTIVVCRSSGLAAGNQARAAVSRYVVVHPLGEHQQSIVKFDQVHQMHEDPGEPGRKPRDMELAEFGHGPIAADRGEIAFV